MLCTAPAASGYFYRLTERNSEMRETSLANFDFLQEMPRTEQSNDGRNGGDEGQFCPTPAPIAGPGPPTYVLRTNSCACLKAAVFASRDYPTKNGTASFEYKTSFCRPPPPTPLPFNSPAQIELASKRSSYATVDVTASWARTRHLSVQMHFCPMKLLCATWIIFCTTTEVVLLKRMSATEDGTAKMEMKKKPSAKRSLRKNAPVKSNSYQWSERYSA